MRQVRSAASPSPSVGRFQRRHRGPVLLRLERRRGGDDRRVVVVRHHEGRARGIAGGHPVRQGAEAEGHRVLVLVHLVVVDGHREGARGLPGREGDGGRHAGEVLVRGGHRQRDLHRALGVGVEPHLKGDAVPLGNRVLGRAESGRHRRGRADHRHGVGPRGLPVLRGDGDRDGVLPHDEGDLVAGGVGVGVLAGDGHGGKGMVVRLRGDGGHPDGVLHRGGIAKDVGGDVRDQGHVAEGEGAELRVGGRRRLVGDRRRRERRGGGAGRVAQGVLGRRGVADGHHLAVAHRPVQGQGHGAAGDQAPGDRPGLVAGGDHERRRGRRRRRLVQGLVPGEHQGRPADHRSLELRGHPVHLVGGLRGEAGMAEDGRVALVVGDAGAALGVEAVGHDADPVRVGIAARHLVGEHQPGPARLPGDKERVASRPAHVEGEARPAGHHHRLAERHLRPDLLADAVGAAGGGRHERHREHHRRRAGVDRVAAEAACAVPRAIPDRPGRRAGRRRGVAHRHAVAARHRGGEGQRHPPALDGDRHGRDRPSAAVSDRPACRVTTGSASPRRPADRPGREAPARGGRPAP